MEYANLNDRNFLIYAMNRYDNPQCVGIEEFNEDISIPIHLKRLLTRYHANGTLKDKLIINHIISFFNIFDPIAATKILLFKIDEFQWSYLKTFLVFLNRCPAEAFIIQGKVVDINKIEIDINLMNKLKNI